MIHFFDLVVHCVIKEKKKNHDAFNSFNGRKKMSKIYLINILIGELNHLVETAVFLLIYVYVQMSEDFDNDFKFGASI